MSNLTLNIDDFRSGLFAVLDECLVTTDENGNSFLDPGDDLTRTLHGITAEQASIVTGSCGNSIASQLRHMAYYLELGVQWMAGNPPQDVDWDAAWKQTSVTDEEWTALKDEFTKQRDAIYEALKQDPPTFGPGEVEGGIAVVAHCAFHLGQIRHALCIARDA